MPPYIRLSIAEKYGCPLFTIYDDFLRDYRRTFVEKAS
jgi:hypothetical protein